MRHRPKLHLDADALPRDGHHARLGELRQSRRGNPPVVLLFVRHQKVSLASEPLNGAKNGFHTTSRGP